MRNKKTGRKFVEYKRGRFLDLRTLGWALRNKSYSLESSREDFGGVEKEDHEPTGRVTLEEIKYCRQDVRATASRLEGMPLRALIGFACLAGIPCPTRGRRHIAPQLAAFPKSVLKVSRFGTTINLLDPLGDLLGARKPISLMGL